MTSRSEQGAARSQTAGQIHNVDIWCFSLNRNRSELSELRRHLSADEIDRASRFIAPIHGDRFIVAHGRLREILASCAGCLPAILQFERSDTGKPYLCGRRAEATPLHFNLTHSGEVAAIAVCRTAEVGIDVEQVRPVSEGLARRYFSSAETEGIADLPEAQRLAAFFRCWTRKEAFVKATGEGIRRGLHSFTVSVAPDEAARVLSIDGDNEAGRAYCLENFEAGEGYAGAVCVATGAAGHGAAFTLREST